MKGKNGTAGGSGSPGGVARGGAIWIQSGVVVLSFDTFNANSVTGGNGGSGG